MGKPELSWRERWAARRRNRELRDAEKLAFRESMVRSWRSRGQRLAAEDKVLEKLPEKMKDAFERMSQEERAAFLSYEALTRRGVKRRTLIGAAAAAYGLFILSFEELLSIDQLTRDHNIRQKEEEYSQYRTTHLEVLDICQKWFHPENGEKAPELFFTSPGIGIGNGYDAARAMAVKGFGQPEDGSQKADVPPMTYLITSMEGKKIPDVANILVEASKMGDGLSLYGQSNGGVVLLEALSYLKEQGIILPVKRLILNCSPFDFADARDNYLERLLGRLLVFSGYDPGEVGKFFFQLKESPDKRENFYMDMLRRVEDAWSVARRGDPTSGWVSDLRILIESRLKDHDFSKIITKDTEVLLLKSDYDGVVQDRNAIRKYQDKLRSYGAKVTVETLPNDAGHADIVAAGQAAHPWLNRTNSAIAA